MMTAMMMPRAPELHTHRPGTLAHAPAPVNQHAAAMPRRQSLYNR